MGLRIVVDLDGVICQLKRPFESYADVEPKMDTIRLMKEWRKQGHYIIIHSARHMKTCKGDVSEVVRRVGDETTNWLKKWEVPYDEIFFGKPYGDIYIDDLAIQFSSAKQVGQKVDASRPIIVMPMAGLGKRFAQAGYDKPKFAICAKGKTFLEWSLASLPLEIADRVVFVCLKQHEKDFSVTKFITKIMGNEYPAVRFEVVLIDNPTRGQAETVLKAKNKIDPEKALVIFNIDSHFLASRLKQQLMAAQFQGIDGIIGVFNDKRPLWSFAEVDRSGFVTRTAEKEPISNLACTGLYIFSKGSEFFKAAEAAINSNSLTKNEFYIAPLYNSLIKEGKKIVVDFADEFWCLGTPEQLEEFNKKYVAKHDRA